MSLRGSESCCVLWRSEHKELLKNVLLLEQLEEGDKDVGLKNVTESLGKFIIYLYWFYLACVFNTLLILCRIYSK